MEKQTNCFRKLLSRSEYNSFTTHLSTQVFDKQQNNAKQKQQHHNHQETHTTMSELQPTIIKSLIDKRTYTYRVLPNQLKILYITDTEADKSAVALAVGVGSAMDPSDWLGLAHFCEHMLFMGTKEYPEPNSFDLFMNKNAGYTNASTDPCFTKYIFECDNKALEESIKRFSSFFCNPLFAFECVEKEIKAIESELALLRKHDGARVDGLAIYSQNPANPFAKDPLELAHKLGTRLGVEKLKEFHEKYYSANIMTVVIYSPMGLEDIEKIATAYFSKVPNKNVNLSGLGVDPPISLDVHKGRLFRVVPAKITRRLVFRWYLPCYQHEYKSMPWSYAEELLGYEGPKSLLSTLKKLGLATLLEVSHDHYPPAFTTFDVVVGLTEKGEKDWERVAETVAGFLKLIRSNEIISYLLKEWETMWKLNFAYSWKEEYLDYTEELVESMHLYSPEEIVAGGAMSIQFSEENIKKFNELLDPLKADLFIVSKDNQVHADKMLTTWGMRYSIEKIPEKLKNRLENPDKVIEYDFPPPNPYIPSLPLIPIATTASPADPSLIHFTPSCEVWYKADFSFSVPQTIITTKVYTSDCFYNSTPFGKLYAMMYDEIISEVTQEIMYQGSEANIDCDIVYDTNGRCGEIAITSYSTPKVAEFIAMLSKIIQNFDLEKCNEVFPRVKENLLKRLRNFARASSLTQGNRYLRGLLFNNQFLPYQLVPILEPMTPEDFYKCFKNWLQKSYCRTYVHGTMSTEDAVSLTKTICAYFTKDALPIDEVLSCNTVKIPPKKVYDYITPSTDDKEVNSFYLGYYQLDEKTDELFVKLELLVRCMKEKTFDTLRTKEQLGYSIEMESENFREVLGISISIESHEYCPEYLLYRVDTFISRAVKEIESLSEDEFAQYKKSERVEYQRTLLNLSEAAEHYGKEVFRCDFDYKWKEKCAKIVDGVSKREIIELAYKLFIDEYKRINVEVVSKQHMDKNMQLYKMNKAKYREKGIIRNRVGKISDFRETSKYYPDKRRAKLIEYVNKSLMKD
eukprot:TRINITY_DN2967_c0_g1_i1.p1 TRINITY_DN2967_c0_g1~~TRINITY_DN2967_c0_g1_i1.p1  ORF type:complete len:1025 (+),score=91.13 TRINITY_DN2967_c0_g1_i1:5248-8322(+)